MKKYLLILSTVIFLLVFVLLPKAAVLAVPSFELYTPCSSLTQFSPCPPCPGYNCTPYPEVDNVSVPTTPSAGTELITADVFDVSGVSSVTAVIKNSSGTTVGNYIMSNVANHYGVTVNVSSYVRDTYTVDVVAVDNLLNSTYDSVAGVNHAIQGTFSMRSADATLSGLVMSPVSLTPTFTQGNLIYNVSVLYGVTSVTLTPTKNNPYATIKVDGNTVASGSASSPISLNVGSNAINVVVIAEDNSTKTYTVNVTRAGASSDATLFSLYTSPSTTFTPIFSSGVSFSSNGTIYAVSVANAVASITVTPTANDQIYATIKVNGTTVASGSASGAIALIPGVNPAINVVVTAQDGTTTNTYKITVTRSAGSTDATLSGLYTTPSTTFTPLFLSSTLSYGTTVLNSVASITVTATRHEPNATITVNGTAVTSGSASGAIALPIGSSTITIIVTAQDTVTQKIYTIVVTRAASGDASLSGLTISYGTLSPAFSSATTSYVDNVGTSASNVTVTPTVAQTGATVKVNGSTVASGSASGATVLGIGLNLIPIVVTAPDTVTTKTYTVSVFYGKCTTGSNATICLSIPTTNSSQINSFTVNGSSSASVYIGDTVALAANLGSGVVGEPVYFVDGSTGAVIGTAVTNASGTASINYTVFGATLGTRTLTAFYNGNQSRGLLTSNKQVTLTIINTGTCANNSNAIICINIPPSNSGMISAFTVTPSTGLTVGTPIALTATLGIAAAGEVVQFMDGASPYNLGMAVVNSTTGTATINYNATTSGSHIYTAIYNGNSSRGFLASVKTVGPVTVSGTGNCVTNSQATICTAVPPANSTQIASFTVNGSSSANAAIGDTVALAANLGSGAVGESVYFTDATTGAVIGTAVTNSSGIASINYTVLGATLGTRTLTAVYNGNQSRGLLASNKQVTLNITSTGTCANNSNAIICINTSPTNAGQITLTAANAVAGASTTLTVTFAAGGAAAGESVQLYDSFPPYNLGSVIVGTGGVAVMYFDATVTGLHTYTAIYRGNPSRGWGASVSTATATISGTGSCAMASGATICIAIPPILSTQISSLTVTPSTGVTVGTPITLTAVLAAGTNAAGEVVQFADSVAPYNLGNATANALGQVTLNYIATTPGSHTFTAIYKGNPSWGLLPSTKTVSLTVTGTGSCNVSGGATICVGESTSLTPH